MNERYYRDPEYGDWVVISVGKNPLRTWYSDLYQLKQEWIGLTRVERISAPPNSNPDWWFTGRMWRREPARKMSWDREGIHAAKGLLVGILVALALVLDFGFWEALGVSAVVYVRFLAYEVTEGLRIKDWAYRDIGGELMGFMVPVVPALLHFIVTGG